jgi:hypothetical protein
MRGFTERMLADLIQISKGHPGVLHKASEYTQELGWDLKVMPDRELETLFPIENYEDWQASQEKQVAAVRELAADWGGRDPADIAERIARLEAAAKDIDQSHPRHTTLLCEEIADRTEWPIRWLRSLLDNGVPPDLIAPFLSGAASSGEEGWEEVARRVPRKFCLEGRHDYRSVDDS